MIKSFTVGVAHTINLGNYESLRVEASITLEEEPNIGQRRNAQAHLLSLVQDTLRAQPHSGVRAMLTDIYRRKAEQQTEERANEPTHNETINRSR